MKKTLLTFVLALIGSVAFCEDLIPLDRKDIRTRSVVTVPEATICGSMLTVSFDSFGLCSLYIEDKIVSMLIGNKPVFIAAASTDVFHAYAWVIDGFFSR